LPNCSAICFGQIRPQSTYKVIKRRAVLLACAGTEGISNHAYMGLSVPCCSHSGSLLAVGCRS
jgi:hypothetical protein